MADATCRYDIAQPEQARPGGGSGVVVVPTLAVIKVKYLTHEGGGRTQQVLPKSRLHGR